MSRPTLKPEDKQRGRCYRATDSEYEKIKENAAKKKLSVTKYVKKRALKQI
jgi:hypothetical protein